MTGRPGDPAGLAVSVVVASCRPEALLDACLASLADQCAAGGAEVLVARAATSAELTRLRARWPRVRWLTAATGSTVPALRGIGLAAATGDVALLTEDHCVADRAWLAELLRASANGADVAGGAMDNAQRTRMVDWGAYFAEYGFFGPGGAGLITAANVAYRRQVLDTVVHLARAGEWENVIHDRLRDAGNRLAFVPTAVVSQNQRYRFWGFCRDRFGHGRDYARRRLRDRSRLRWLLLSGAIALPPLLAARVFRAIAPIHRGRFLRALPATLAFLTAWAVGEAAGYLAGPPRGGTGR